MDQIKILSIQSSVILILILCITFLITGVLYSKKYLGIKNYLLANRKVETFSLTSSFVASALGAWILFGPASAATWGGIGSVVGYSLGAGFPLFILIFLGEKFRKKYPTCRTLIEVIRIKFKKRLFKLILFLSIFYMTIFLIAEVTAVSLLINYISGTDLWITALIIISTSLAYTLYGGLRASIYTDNVQFIAMIILLIVAFGYIIYSSYENYSFEFIKNSNPHLLSGSYLPNFTAGLTFFIAVAATNLFHQGNWQRVYAAKNNKMLKKSLLISFLIIIPVVFFMGFTGLVTVSENQEIIPDLAFFYILLKEQVLIISIVIIVLAISLTVSSIDTLINAISSLVIVDGRAIIRSKGNYFEYSKYIIILLCFIAFFISSKGFSVLYLFLLADLLCCSAVLTVFFSFYNNGINVTNAWISIIIGLFFGLMFFPSPDFSKSILIGLLLPSDIFPKFLSQSLLFTSFFLATLTPLLTWKINKKV
tara:strand:- start:991 stop:2430 length:1440 start_codon:yes stop_codon:yes gene_type:complete